MGNPVSCPSQNGTCTHLSTFSTFPHWATRVPLAVLPIGPAQHFKCWKHLTPPLIEGCGWHHVTIHPPASSWRIGSPCHQLTSSSKQGSTNEPGTRCNWGGPYIRRLVHSDVLAWSWPGNADFGLLGWASTPLVPFHSTRTAKRYIICLYAIL